MKQFVVVAICSLLLISTQALALDVGEVQIHGFVSQGYLKSDDANYLADTKKGTYQFNEAGINFNFTKDKLRVGAQIFSRDIGAHGNNDVKLDWAVGEYRIFDELGLRAGRCKMPYGLYNQGRDIDFLRTPIFLPNSLYDEGMRNIVNAYNGFSIFGNINAQIAGSFEYETFIGTIDFDEDDFWGLFLADDTDVTPKQSTGFSLRWDTPLPGLRLGTNYSLHKIDLEWDQDMALGPGVNATLDIYHGMETGLFAHSAEFIWQDLTLAAEYTTNRVDHDQRIDGPDNIPGVNLDSKTEGVGKSHGWYASGSYQVVSWLTLGLYYTEYYEDSDDTDGQDYVDRGLPASYAWQKEWVPTLRFDPVPNWVIKAEVHFVDGSARCFSVHNPEGFPDSWNLYALKTSFCF